MDTLYQKDIIVQKKIGEEMKRLNNKLGRVK